MDILSVQVRNIARESKLLKTRVTDGVEDFSVVTNMMHVKSDMRLAAAFLPPREVGGTVSEAMFLGSDTRPEEAGTQLTEEEVDAREAASILYDEMSGHG